MDNIMSTVFVVCTFTVPLLADNGSQPQERVLIPHPTDWGIRLRILQDASTGEADCPEVEE